MKKNKFEDNLFYKNFYGKNGFLTPIMIKMVKEGRGKDSVNLEKDEQSTVDCFKLVKEIDLKIRDLNYCIYLIKYYPSNKKLRDNITRHDYIIYHLEYFYINVVALFDRILKLSNFVHDIGLSDKYVKLDILITNKKISKQHVSALKKFNKSIEEIRGIQNNIKHKEKLKDPGIKNAQLLESLYRVNNLDKKSAAYLGSKKEYNKYIKDKVQKIKEFNDTIEVVVFDLVDSFYSTYESNFINK